MADFLLPIRLDISPGQLYWPVWVSLPKDITVTWMNGFPPLKSVQERAESTVSRAM
jgi:hypothetical protein